MSINPIIQGIPINSNTKYNPNNFDIISITNSLPNVFITVYYDRQYNNIIANSSIAAAFVPKLYSTNPTDIHNNITNKTINIIYDISLKESINSIGVYLIFISIGYSFVISI